MTPGTLFEFAKTVTPDNMKEALQQAIEIEIATIPVYLYTYYSINRQPDQDQLEKKITADLLKAGFNEQDAKSKALDMSVELMVFANKAGALIMSVVVEEMLHMSLSSNVKQALVGMPELVGKTPKIWPAHLPGHKPEFPINRSKFTLDQLKTFLLIESPEKFTEGDKNKAEAIEYTTIGQYYGMLEKCIKKHYKDDDQYHTDRPQLVPGKGYYAHNSVDSIYYDKMHKPQYANAGDSGDLIHVVNQKTALAALEEIVEQGEGFKGGDKLKKSGEPDCAKFDKKGKINPKDYDDPKTHEELSHFDKFLELYCKFKDLNAQFQNDLNDKDFEIHDYFVMNLPDNPATKDYPAPLQKVSDLTNAIYTYIFVMTEACYKKDGNTQYEIFMFGIHKSMIWLLNSLCQEMTGMSYIGPDGKSYTATCTFEDYSFSQASSPKSQIIDLANEAIAVNSGLSWVLEKIEALPDVGLEEYLEVNS